MLHTAVTRAIVGGVKPVVQTTSVERGVTIARTVINVVRTKYVVTTNARIRVLGALGLLQALLSVQLSSSPSSFPS